MEYRLNFKVMKKKNTAKEQEHKKKKIFFSENPKQNKQLTYCYICAHRVCVLIF